MSINKHDDIHMTLLKTKINSIICFYFRFRFENKYDFKPHSVRVNNNNVFLDRICITNMLF